MKFAYLISLFLFIRGVWTESQNKRFSKLLDDSRYDYSVPPVTDDALDVSVFIRFYNIHSADVETMEFSTEMFVQLKWTDPRLSQEDGNFTTNTTKLYIPEYINKVWRPNIYFSNEKTARIHDVPQTNEYMYILSDGEIVYNMRLSMTHGCFMELKLYPFDIHTCTIDLMSYSYESDIVQLNWDTPGIEGPHKEFLHFDLDTVVPKKDVLVTKVGSYSRLSIDFVFKRCYDHYLFTLYTPSFLILILSWISFWIDPTVTPGRLSLGSVCVLTMVTNHAGMQARMPSVSCYVKAIDTWMIGCEILVSIALIEFAIVHFLFLYSANREENPSKAKRVDFHFRWVYIALFIVMIAVYIPYYQKMQR